jgi:hypothetical protein
MADPNPLPVVPQPEPHAAAPSIPAPSPKVTLPAANLPPRVATETHRTRANVREPAEEDVGAEEKAPEEGAARADDDSRNREARPRQRQRQRVEPRAEQPAPAAAPAPPESPDWIVERRRQKAHSSQTRFQTGTNAAPIFD